MKHNDEGKEEADGRWIRVQAQMPNDERVSQLSDPAFRLHVSVKCWCGQNMTDGHFKAHVPSSMPRAPHGKKLTDAIAEIVRAGLWIPTEDGYQVRKFLKYNMSRAEWERLKAAGKLGGQRSGESRRKKKGRSKSEAGASAPAQANPKQVVKHSPKPKPSRGRSKSEAPPEQEKDQDQERSKYAAAKDLKASARVAAENQAAAAAGVLRLQPDERARLLLQSPDLAPQWQPWAWPEVQAFGRSLSDAWGRPVSFGSVGDPVVRLLLDALASGAADALPAAGRHLGSWLAEDGPDGRARSLTMVTFSVLRKALEEAGDEARVQAGANELLRAAGALGGSA